MKCDVNADTTLSLLDLFMILRHIVRIDTLAGPVEVPGTELWGADANGDQAINILDLMKCINKSVGRVDPKAVIPAVVLSDVVALPNRTASVPVEVVSESDLAGLLLRLAYDPSAMTVGRPQLSERASGMELDYGLVDGELLVLVSSLAGQTIKAGSGAVLQMPFAVGEGTKGSVSIEVIEPIVFTADEQVLFSQGSVVMVTIGDLVPVEYSLSQNYPNPFNPTTAINYQIPNPKSQSLVHTTLMIFNVLGQEVATLVNEVKEPGYYTARWDGTDGKGNEVPSGIYFYRLTAGGTSRDNREDFTATRSMVLMK
jgi:hypothetical protein